MIKSNIIFSSRMDSLLNWIHICNITLLKISWL
jgi:hypothetical protein